MLSRQLSACANTFLLVSEQRGHSAAWSYDREDGPRRTGTAPASPGGGCARSPHARTDPATRLGFWASKTLLSAVEHSPTSHSAPCRRGLRHKSRGYMAPDGRRPSFLCL